MGSSIKGNLDPEQEPRRLTDDAEPVEDEVHDGDEEFDPAVPQEATDVPREQVTGGVEVDEDNKRVDAP